MIIFTKDIPENILLTAYNNHVVKFLSDSGLTPLYCDISGMGIAAKLYPNPDKSFRFDFKEYVSSIVNTKKFAGDSQTNLVSNDSSTFTYDVTDGTYVSGIVTFKITFIDATFEVAPRDLKFLAGVYQLEDYKQQQIPNQSNFIILSPVKKRSDNSVNLKFWEGYPFEFSFYTSLPDSNFKLLNTRNGTNYEFLSKGNITSLWLSDGRTDVTIEDFLPLSYGINVLNIISGNLNQNLNINLDKVNSDCGIYVKWLNKLGRWNYWLLNKIHKIDLSSKYSAELSNDFENLEDTFSPTIQSGKVSYKTLQCNVKNLNENERDVFIGLLTSPKIYYFTGERFSRSSSSEWIEVRLKTANTKIEDSNKKRFTFLVDIELPTQYSQTL